jgi:hypothetical protein
LPASTRIEAQTTVAWEGDRASGTVVFAPDSPAPKLEIPAPPAPAPDPSPPAPGPDPSPLPPPSIRRPPDDPPPAAAIARPWLKARRTDAIVGVAHRSPSMRD